MQYHFYIMKQVLSILIAFSFVALVQAAPKVAKMQHVHPAFWWADMKNSELQVLLHAENIGNLEVAVSSADIRLNEVVRPANPNYLILYLNVKDAAPQKFDFLLTDAKGKTRRVPYELKEREQLQRTPFDASDVVYLFMPDRFANGNTENDVVEGLLEQGCDPEAPDARHGGDIAGVISKLDYLNQLGVTAIWHTPMLVNDMPSHSYHGYGITDLYNIDPRFGTNEDYRQMVQEAHKKDIKVIMDMVFNHCGSRNFIFADRPADDWFNFDSKYVQTTYKLAAISDQYASQIDRKLAQDGWFVEVMPDLNQKNPHVMKYLIQNSIWWIEYAGIDGIRQDTYPYAELEPMAEWIQAVETEYPGFNIVGETWVNNNVTVSYWQKDSKLAAPRNSQLRTVMDFPLMSLLNTIAEEETNDWDRGLARIHDYLSQDIVYANPMGLLTFLDNHDTDRFSKTAEQAQNFNRYRQSLTLLLTLRGIPQLFYGDEIGMFGNKWKGDGALRENFPGGFANAKANAFTREGRSELQNQYYDFTSKLLNWRKGNAAIAKGTPRHYSIQNGVYVYSRQAEGRTVTVIMNGCNAPASIDLARYEEVLPKNGKAHEVLTGETLELGKNIHLDIREILILDF